MNETVQMNQATYESMQRERAALEQRVAVLGARLRLMAVSYHTVQHKATEPFVTCGEFSCIDNRATLAPQPQEVEP